VSKDNIKMNLKEIEFDFVAGCLNVVGTVIRAVIVGSNPTAGMDVCLLCVVRSIFDKLITRQEESYRVWCVVECDLETS
jgi:hypothetical protein